jgi:drug/metabolite transporter (DMT)-like permease
MYNFFVWMLLTSGFIFGIINIVFVIRNRMPQARIWKYILLGLGVLMLCGLIGMVSML